MDPENVETISAPRLIGQRCNEHEYAVAWISTSFGYNNDLMYFGRLFAAFCERFPKTRIVVDHEFPVEKYPCLPLWPILHSMRFRRRRGLHGVDYSDDLMIPHFSTLWHLLWAPVDVYIIIEFTPVALLGLLVARLKRRRAILLIENDPRFRGNAGGRLTNAIKGILARTADLVMTNNEHGHTFVSSVLKVSEARIQASPYLTSEALRSERDDQGAVLPSPRSDQINLLFLNSLTHRKGIDKLLMEFASLPSAVRAQMHLHIVGDGPLRPIAELVVERHKLADSVTFYGAISFGHTHHFYEIADVFISPSLADYRSLAGFEAIRAGCVLILSRYDGAQAELLKDGVNGYIVDPLHAGSIAEALVQLVDKRQQLGLMTEASFELAKGLGFEDVADNLQRAVRRSLGLV